MAVRVVVDLTAVLLVGDHLVEGLCVFNTVQTCPPRVCSHHTCDFEAVLVANQAGHVDWSLSPGVHGNLLQHQTELTILQEI